MTHPSARRGSTAFMRANPIYTQAKAKGSEPMPLALGEVAEYGRPSTIGHKLRLLACGCFGVFALLSVCVFLWSAP
jgi:hypothetical protein